MSTVFSTQNDYRDQPMFFGEPLGVARYDQIKYPQIEKLTQQQQGYFWRPQEFDLSKDPIDFKSLNKGEQHIFTGNLKRQIVLDTVQGRAPELAFGPLTSLPEVDDFIGTWTFFERIHSRSYTHIIRNIYSNPSLILGTVMDIPEITELAADITFYYDELIKTPSKENLWMAMNAVNALEGIRFYVSFACSWAFAEQKKMEGNAKIIKFIARDENLHLAFSQQVLKILPKEDPEFAEIKEARKEDVQSVFEKVMKQEKNWAKYLFNDGSMLGLNEEILCDYVDFIGAKRTKAIGVQGFKYNGSNPLPWTQSYIGGSDVQLAAQETELPSYILGGTKSDLISTDRFNGFKL